MRNYAPPLPRGKDEEAMQEFPAPTSVLARYGSENSTSSSVISLTHDTTLLEIAAIGNSAVMRWVRTADSQSSVVSAASGTNFNHVIGSGTVRRFVVPIETNPQTGSVQGINRELGLYQRVAIKSIGIASVLMAEF